EVAPPGHRSRERLVLPLHRAEALPDATDHRIELLDARRVRRRGRAPGAHVISRSSLVRAVPGGERAALAELVLRPREQEPQRDVLDLPLYPGRSVQQAWTLDLVAPRILPGLEDGDRLEDVALLVVVDRILAVPLEAREAIVEDRR